MQFDNTFVLALFTGEVGSVGLQTVTLSEPFLANISSHDLSPENNIGCNKKAIVAPKMISSDVQSVSIP